MAQLVNDNTSLKVSISERCGYIPKIHSATTILTIRRSHEVGVVVPATVLSVSNDGVILGTSATEVVLLEVASDLVKAIPTQHTVSA